MRKKPLYEATTLLEGRWLLLERHSGNFDYEFSACSSGGLFSGKGKHRRTGNQTIVKGVLAGRGVTWTEYSPEEMMPLANFSAQISPDGSSFKGKATFSEITGEMQIR